jgi:hypothetical protein
MENKDTTISPFHQAYIGFETLASSISKYIDAINHKLQ